MRECFGVSNGRRVVVRATRPSQRSEKFATEPETPPPLLYRSLPTAVQTAACTFLANFHNGDSKSENLIRIKARPWREIPARCKRRWDTGANWNRLTGESRRRGTCQPRENSVYYDIIRESTVQRAWNQLPPVENKCWIRFALANDSMVSKICLQLDAFYANAQRRFHHWPESTRNHPERAL